MAVLEAQVFVLEDLVTLVLRGDSPHLVRVFGAESVRAAAVMAHLLILKRSNADKDRASGNGNKEASGNGEREDADEKGFGSGDNKAEEDEDENGFGGGDEERWIVPNMEILERVAHVDGLLHKLYLDVIPKLKKHPGDDRTLRSLDIIAKDLRRVGKIVPGDVGKLSVKLGNKIGKLVSHAFNKRGKCNRRKAGGQEKSKGKFKVGGNSKFKVGGNGKFKAGKHPKVARTMASRGTFIARRLEKLINQVENLHDECPVVLI